MRRPSPLSPASWRARLDLSSLRGAKRRGNPSLASLLSDCFASLAMTSAITCHAGVHRLAEMRRARAHLAVEHRVLGLRNFLLRRHLAFAVGHGFDHGFGFAQVFAAAASHFRRGSGPTARITAAIAAAPSNLLLMLLSCSNRSSIIAGFCGTDCSLSRISCGMNFAREKCDRRVAQTCHARDAF